MIQFRFLELMSGETRRPWTSEEDEAIRVIVAELGTKHWSDISQLMQEKYKLFGRSGKQCRERWHNHLAPDVNKRPWSKQEQQILFEAHKKYGNKWTQISKLIEGRTDNAIKNHFYSSIRRSLRRINKILGSKNSTVKMRSVKPAVLSAIFNLADKEEESNSQDYKDLTSALIQFSRNRVKKEKSITEEEKIGLENLIKKLMEFNDVYEKDKKENKKICSSGEVFKGVNLSTTSSKRIRSQDQEIEEEDEQEEQSPRDDQSLKEEPSIVHQPLEEFEDHTRARMNLEESEYDWQQFQQRCQTIVNRYLISQNSLKSMEILPSEEMNQTSFTDHCSRSKKKSVKSEKQSVCSSNDVIVFERTQKSH